jgi:hypothetical protein
MYAYKRWPSSVQGLATRIGARHADAAIPIKRNWRLNA